MIELNPCDPCVSGASTMARLTFKLWRPAKDEAILFGSVSQHIQVCNLIRDGIVIGYEPFGKN